MLEARYEFGITIEHNTKWHTMQSNYLLNVQVSQLLRSGSGLDG